MMMSCWNGSHRPDRCISPVRGTCAPMCLSHPPPGAGPHLCGAGAASRDPPAHGRGAVQGGALAAAAHAGLRGVAGVAGAGSQVREGRRGARRLLSSPHPCSQNPSPSPLHPAPWACLACRQHRLKANLVLAAQHYDEGRLRRGVFRAWRAEAASQLRLRVSASGAVGPKQTPICAA